MTRTDTGPTMPRRNDPRRLGLVVDCAVPADGIAERAVECRHHRIKPEGRHRGQWSLMCGPSRPLLRHTAISKPRWRHLLRLEYNSPGVVPRP